VFQYDQLATLIPLISARILRASGEELDQVIQESLREVLRSLRLERGGLLEVAEGVCRVVVSYVWYDAGVETVSKEINLAQTHPWTYHQLVILGKTVTKYGLDSMPEEAELDRLAFIRMGIRSALLIPLFLEQRVHHIIVVHSLRHRYQWPEQFIEYLRLLGEIFVSALERRAMLHNLVRYQERLDLAAASAGAGLWEMNQVDRSIWLTQQTRVLFDFAPDEEVTFDRFVERIDPQDRPKVVEALETSLNHDHELRLEYRVIAPDGATRWMLSQGRVHPQGPNGSLCLTGVTLDITQRKHMEQQLLDQVEEITRLREQLEQENRQLRSEAGLNQDRHGSLGNSAAMLAVRARIEQVAPTDSTVLLQGETGTGKEMIAQAIHQLSGRSKRLMVTVNCAALPSALIESELFGREKGAYTGALSRQVGRFEQAHGSTLLLDEIAEMPMEAQVKLLRVLQDGSFERLGSPVNRHVDVRIIAATNRNLVEEVEQGRFRRDLFYRLNVFPIHVPPLRERTADIPLLVWKFVNEFGQRMGRKISRITREDMGTLSAYSWPGNVRELRNVIERAMITSQGTVLDLSLCDLSPPCPVASVSCDILPLEEVERRHIRETLRVTQGRVKGRGGAAEILGLNPSTLYSPACANWV